MRVLSIALSVALVSPSLPRVARAEPTAAELHTARKLFEKGIQQEEALDWGGALDTFRKVAAIKTNHIVRFHVALCLEKTGRLVDALNEFALAKTQAEHEGGTDAELTIANSTKHAAALRARIPTVRVKRPDAAAATLHIDGAPVATSLFGAEIPLDPGAHAVEVRADGYIPYRKKVTLVDGAPTPIDLAPTLVKIAEEPKPHPTLPVAGPDYTAAWIMGSIGVAALTGAGVAYVVRSSALREVDASCDANRENCDPGTRSIDERGRTATVVGNVLLGVGVAAAATTLVLIVLEPARKDAPRVTAAVGPASFSLRATF